MPFTYHPPTRKSCKTCEALGSHLNPISNSEDGKASNANNFTFHNWYNFVLGYSPRFPNYIIDREGITKKHFVVDPFMGSGTTLICCKRKGIVSSGVDANNYFKFAAEVKLMWRLNPQKIEQIKQQIITKAGKRLLNFKWSEDDADIFKKGNKSIEKYVAKNRPKLLLAKYLSDKPFVKLNIILEIINKHSWQNKYYKNLFLLAFASIILPSSNVRYGPGFGVIKPREKIDVLTLFKEKIDRMISDLSGLKNNEKLVKANVHLGDSRNLSKIFKDNSVDFIITSPPYPGDHEYTKHSKLELIFLNHANTLDEFRTIKKRMLRGSTTNVYKQDNEGDAIRDIEELNIITKEIDKRISQDNGTSGFEKLYSKLVWEYFGGMYNVFCEAKKILRPKGKFVLLVSDSHAFKMVHIETAGLLAKVAEKAGFNKIHIELWQYKTTTSHKYRLFENILTVEK